MQLPAGEVPQPVMSGMISLYYAVYFLSKNQLAVLRRWDIRTIHHFSPTRKEILRLRIHVKSTFKLCVKGN